MVKPRMSIAKTSPKKPIKLQKPPTFEFHQMGVSISLDHPSNWKVIFVKVR
jgi:hypothetical protein